MTTINMFDLCKRMQAQGFEYGSLTPKSTFEALANTTPPFRRLTLKPEHGVWFSKISESYDEENPDDDDCVSLEWHNFIMSEDFHREIYEKRPIVFAKFDMDRLANESDSRFQAHGSFRDDTLLVHMPDWQAVSCHYAGVHVDPCKLARPINIFHLWDVNTVCAWDMSVITEMIWFEPAGQPWTYKLA